MEILGYFYTKQPALRKTIIYYGAALGLALIALKMLEYSFFYRQIDLEIYLGLVALAFLAIGIYLGIRYGMNVSRKRTLAEMAPSSPDPAVLAEIGLSKRELEVLELLGEGLSNQEIADRLFVSLNTIKTHVNRVYTKLEVNRRTQAVNKAKALHLIS